MSNREKKLNRTLNSMDILVVSFGAMIGWGWVVSSGEWIHDAGVVGTTLGFVIGGILIYFVGMVYAELTTAIPQSGGCLLFCNRAFGPAASFVCTWSMVFGYIGVVCFEACSLPTIVAYVVPNFLQGYLYTVGGFDVYATWVITAVLFAVLITWVNIKGVKSAAFLQNILTSIMAAVGILLIVFSALNGSAENLQEHIISGDHWLTQAKNVISIAGVAPFFLFGFDVIPQVAEEINVERRKIGRILVLSISMAVAFYVLVVISIGYAMNAEEIALSLKGEGLVAADAMKKMLRSEIMAKVLIIGGLCGIVTSWNSFLIGGSRALFSLSEARMIPHVFSKLHDKYATPKYALWLAGGLSILAPFLGRAMLSWISNTASFACCLAYGMVSVAYLVLRKKEPDMERPFRVKHWKVIGSLAVLMCGYMIAMYLLPGTGSSLGKEEWFIVCAWTVMGLIFALPCKMKHRESFGRSN